MLKVEQPYPNGVPQTVISSWHAAGLGWHWSAGATGRAGWEGTVRFLISSRYTLNASYHGGFWPEHKAGHVGCVTVIQWIVRTDRAAHSVNPAQCWQYHSTKNRAVQDSRFAEVRRILGPKASDPNAGMIALAYAGMPADLDKDLACPVFREDLDELAQQLIDHPTVIDRPHFGHGWIQPVSRYEMDTAKDFIGLLYGDDMPTPKLSYVPQLWKARAGGAALREQASLDSPVIARVPEGGIIFTLGEAPTTREGWRLAVAGDPESLFYIYRPEVDPLPPTPRDPELHSGIAGVVNARAAGKPIPAADCSTELSTIETQSDLIATLKTKISTAQAALK